MLDKLRIDYIIFGGLGLFLLLSILTSDFQDPTFFNQLYPSLGIKNWTGLIGALIGGSLIEIFGSSSLFNVIIMIFYVNYSKNLELLFALDKLNIVRNKRGLRLALKMFLPLSFPT